MRIVMFYHSLLSDWNHGNAHFLRGVVSELQHRGHTVDVYEPAGAWSLENLLADQGVAALEEFHRAILALPVTSMRRKSLILTGSWKVQTWCWCTSGTAMRWCARLGAIAAATMDSGCSFMTPTIAR